MSSFRAYIELIILYNCKIWTITSQAENTINAFQRRLLNTYVLNMKWPNTVRIEEVYKRTRATEWSTTIQKKTIEMVWENNLTRRLNTCRESFWLRYCPIPETPWQTSFSQVEYYKIWSHKAEPRLGRRNKHCSRYSNTRSYNK